MFEISMNGPAKNALGSDAMRFLIDRLAEAAGRPVLLTGSGDAFSAGLNLKEVASLDAAGMETFLRLLERMTTTLFTYPAPTVALVNGHAIAGGCVIALCRDYRVAARDPKSRIGLNEVAIGLRFPPAILSIVRHVVPRRHFEEIVLGGALHDPAEALRLGLVDLVTDDPRAAAVARLEALARSPAAAYAGTKADVRRGVVPPSPEEERLFLDEVLPTWTAPDLKARLLEVLARRA